jgi:hypothetical protein
MDVFKYTVNTSENEAKILEKLMNKELGIVYNEDAMV